MNIFTSILGLVIGVMIYKSTLMPLSKTILIVLDVIVTMSISLYIQIKHPDMFIEGNGSSSPGPD